MKKNNHLANELKIMAKMAVSAIILATIIVALVFAIINTQ